MLCRAATLFFLLSLFAFWLAQGSHALTEWHCDWSSQTGASVCGILHGRNDDILGDNAVSSQPEHVFSVRRLQPVDVGVCPDGECESLGVRGQVVGDLVLGRIGPPRRGEGHPWQAVGPGR